MVYKHAYLNTLLLLHSAFYLSVVNMPPKGEVGGHALKSHGNYIVDHGKIMELRYPDMKPLQICTDFML